MEFKGLDDNCEMMTTMRKFRDGYMLKKYPSEVQKYYRVSPPIVDRIQACPDRETILNDTYDTICRAVDLIKKGDNEEAYSIYKKMVEELSAKVS